MQALKLKQFGAVAALAMAALAASAQEHPALKRPVNVPPSADLSYKIQARQKGIALEGEALLSWRAEDGKYSASNLSRAQILGKILENRSEGTIDEFGLAPARFTEKRFRKAETTAIFDRAGKIMGFSESEKTYPLHGGEQDRGSAQWQLVAVARAAPEKFTPGSEWKFFVAGRKDAERWVFKVVKRETIKTGLGELQAVHLTKAPPADSKEQQLDIWLAPKHGWYPVKLRFSDEEGEFVEQTVQAITKR